MDRASRFIWALECGRKDRKLFKKVLRVLCRVIRKTGDLSLITDGERRYGNLLFELCSEVLREGKVGRPKTTLPIIVRLLIVLFVETVKLSEEKNTYAKKET